MAGSARSIRLSDTEWEAIQPHLPQGRRGARRVDDRRVISGIRHMLRSGSGAWLHRDGGGDGPRNRL